eukprot:709355-Amphidinium_carterae.1
MMMMMMMMMMTMTMTMTMLMLMLMMMMMMMMMTYVTLPSKVVVDLIKSKVGNSGLLGSIVVFFMFLYLLSLVASKMPFTCYMTLTRYAIMGC